MRGCGLWGEEKRRRGEEEERRRGEEERRRVEKRVEASRVESRR
jgi:hypothetical protein